VVQQRRSSVVVDGKTKTKASTNKKGADNGQHVVILDPRSPSNEFSKAQIPSIEQHCTLYKDPDMATKVHSFLKKDGMNIRFPVRDTLGGLESGGTVTYAFFYLGEFIRLTDELGLRQMVECDKKFREISRIIAKLRV
jgi:hypothetical protein